MNKRELAKVYSEMSKGEISARKALKEIEIFFEDNFNDNELKIIFDFFVKINKFKNEQLLKNK